MNNHKFIVREQVTSCDKQLDESVLDGLEKLKHLYIVNTLLQYFFFTLDYNNHHSRDTLKPFEERFVSCPVPFRQCINRGSGNIFQFT